MKRIPRPRSPSDLTMWVFVALCLIWALPLAIIESIWPATGETLSIVVGWGMVISLAAVFLFAAIE